MQQAEVNTVSQTNIYTKQENSHSLCKYKGKFFCGNQVPESRQNPESWNQAKTAMKACANDYTAA